MFYDAEGRRRDRVPGHDAKPMQANAMQVQCVYKINY